MIYVHGIATTENSIVTFRRAVDARAFTDPRSRARAITNVPRLFRERDRARERLRIDMAVKTFSGERRPLAHENDDGVANAHRRANALDGERATSSGTRCNALRVRANAMRANAGE